MVVLQICQKPPFPPVDGGCIAMKQISETVLDLGHELIVLSMETYKHPLLKDQADTNLLSLISSYRSIFVDIKVNPVSAFLNLFSNKSYNIERFNHKSFRKELISILKSQDIDVVIFESLYTTCYLSDVRKYSNSATLYRSHNLEQLIWQHHYQNEKNPFLKWYFKLLYHRIRIYENEITSKFDSVAAISENEKTKITELCKVSLIDSIPVYHETDDIEIGPMKPPIGFFHIGSMDWKPNQEGIQWFLEEVWKKFEPKEKISLHLAGRSMPNWLENLKMKGVKIHGKVPNSIQFIDKHDVMIVPLFSASGIRVKILEAMSRGKVVLCTSVAAEGIDYRNNNCMLIADSAEEFRKEISNILADKYDLYEMGRNALELIKKNHSPKNSLQKLEKLLNKIGHDE